MMRCLGSMGVDRIASRSPHQGVIKRWFSACGLMMVLLSGCGGPPQPSMTPAQLQKLQSRVFKAPKPVVLASIVSVFQDLGYSITQADVQTGLVNAEYAPKSHRAIKWLFAMTKINETKATAFIESVGQQTKARLNLIEVNQVSFWWEGKDKQYQPILDPRVYQGLFAAIDQAIIDRTAR